MLLQGQARDVARALFRGARQGDGGQVQGGPSDRGQPFVDIEIIYIPRYLVTSATARVQDISED